MDNIVYNFDISEENKKFIEHNLELYNFSKNKFLNPSIYKIQPKKFGFYAYDDGNLIGGAYGFIDYEQWIYLDLLFVNENYRNNDIGTNLIKRVEKFAKENNCIGIRTETWSFQALGFYEKMGFTLYGKLENHPPQAIDYLLKKVLVEDVNDFCRTIK